MAIRAFLQSLAFGISQTRTSTVVDLLLDGKVIGGGSGINVTVWAPGCIFPEPHPGYTITMTTDQVDQFITILSTSGNT